MAAVVESAILAPLPTMLFAPTLHHSRDVQDPDNSRHSGGTCYHCDPGGDICDHSKTHNHGDMGSSKAPVTLKAQAVLKRVPVTLLAEMVDGGKCWLPNITRTNSGKRNQQLVLWPWLA